MSFFSPLMVCLRRISSLFIFSSAPFLILFLNIALAHAGEVMARWSPSPETNVKGYRVYYGPASRYYLHYIDIGPATSCTITNLEEGKTYYFAATAYDESGYESDYSAEGVYQVPVQYAIQPASQSFQASGGGGTVQVIAPAGGSWKAESNVPWLIITSNPAGVGRGTVGYAVQSNPTISPRKGTLAIAGFPFTVSQDGQALPRPVFAVNCGGPQYTDSTGTVYQADARYSGGGTYKTTAAIADTEHDPLYQSERYGTFSYNIPLSPGAYTVTLHFAEIYNYTPGSRVFSVRMEGKEIITNLDLYARAGRYRAVDFQFPVAVSDGTLNIEFRPVKGNPKVSAIAVYPAGSLPQFTINANAGAGGMISPQGAIPVNYGANQAFQISANAGYRIADVKVDAASKGAVAAYTFTNVTANQTIEASFIVAQPVDPPIFAVNCGGPKYVDPNGVVYQADTKFAGGSTSSTTTPIQGTEDGLLYQSERYGFFYYNIPVPKGNYRVILKFAEIYPYAGVGSRVFDVRIEGKEVISNLDLLFKVGRYKAYDVPISVTVIDGVLDIHFRADKGSAKINAILVQKE